MIDISMIDLNQIIYTVYMACVIISGIFIYRYYKRGTVYILRKFNDTYKLVKKIKIKDTVETISYRNKSFRIDLKKTAFLNSSKPQIFIDFDTGSILSFKEIKTHISPDELDNYVNKKIVSQLVGGLLFNQQNIFMYCIFFAFGIALGLALYPYIPQPTSMG